MKCFIYPCQQLVMMSDRCQHLPFSSGVMNNGHSLPLIRIDFQIVTDLLPSLIAAKLLIKALFGIDKGRHYVTSRTFTVGQCHDCR